jgi:hypothetical protein
VKPWVFARCTSSMASVSLVATFATCAVFGPLPSMSDDG